MFHVKTTQTRKNGAAFVVWVSMFFWSNKWGPIEGPHYLVWLRDAELFLFFAKKHKTREKSPNVCILGLHVFLIKQTNGGPIEGPHNAECLQNVLSNAFLLNPFLIFREKHRTRKNIPVFAFGAPQTKKIFLESY